MSQTKEYQKAFRSNLARQLFPKEFERIENFQGLPDRYKMKQITKIVKPIRTKHNKLLIRRRQTFELYQAVFILPFFVLLPNTFHSLALSSCWIPSFWRQMGRRVILAALPYSTMLSRNCSVGLKGMILGRNDTSRVSSLFYAR